MNKNKIKCKYCGRDFISSRKTHIYCSSKCNNSSWIMNNKEKRKEHIKKYIQSEKGKLAQEKSIYKYRNSEKGILKSKEYKQSENGKLTTKKYKQSEKGKITNKKYRQSKKGQETQKRAFQKYCQTEKGKEMRKKACKKFNQSEKGKLIYIKKNAKRRRQLNFIPIMDNPFPKETKVEWHHTNNMFVIPIPEGWHIKGKKRDYHRKIVNNLIEKNGFEISVFTQEKMRDII